MPKTLYQHYYLLIPQVQYIPSTLHCTIPGSIIFALPDRTMPIMPIMNNVWCIHQTNKLKKCSKTSHLPRSPSPMTHLSSCFGTIITTHPPLPRILSPLIFFSFKGTEIELFTNTKEVVNLSIILLASHREAASNIINIWWHMPLFFIYYFHRLILTLIRFTYSNFCLGAAWWSGRDVVWRLVFFGSALS